VSSWFGSLPSTWIFQATLSDVSDGIHMVTVQDALADSSAISTGVGTYLQALYL
jgi:hypothetical protein